MPRVSMRDALVEAGQTVLHQRGYAATAVQDIAAAAGVPKGSFFNHFGTKEAFAAIALERYVSAGEAGITAVMSNPDLPFLQKVDILLGAVIRRVSDTGAREGCMVGNFSLEVAGSSEALRQQLSEAFGRWRAPTLDALTKAQAKGEIKPRIDPETLADFIQNGLQGALLRAKVDRTSKPLEQFKAVLMDYLSA